MGRSGKIYRKVRAKFVQRPTFFSWVNDKTLSASGLPSSESQVAWLAKTGVNTILSLTEEPLPKEWLDRYHLKGVHIRMADHQSPTAEQMNVAVETIKAELESGRRLHVHCLAGKGRTGSVLAAYLARTEGTSMMEAIEHLRKKRPGSVEYPQERFLLLYEQSLGSPYKDRE